MNMMNELRAFLLETIRQGATQTEIAKAAAMQQSSLSRFLKNGEGLSADNFLKLLDWAGWSVEKADAAARDVRFVDARPALVAGNDGPPPDAGDYLAVPVVEEAKAGPDSPAGEEVKSWFLVDRNLPAARCRRNLIAVEIGKDTTGMSPLLHAGDIVLVDRDDRDASPPGRLMLVLAPDGRGLIRRVCVEPLDDGDVCVAYYSDDARRNPPLCRSLRKDFGGDWDRVVVGRVIRAWSDMREK